MMKKDKIASTELNNRGMGKAIKSLCPKVKCRIDVCDDHEEGEIVDGYLIAIDEDTERALLYLPSGGYGCACYAMCNFVDDGIYETCSLALGFGDYDHSYVNVH